MRRSRSGSGGCGGCFLVLLLIAGATIVAGYLWVQQSGLFGGSVELASPALSAPAAATATAIVAANPGITQKQGQTAEQIQTLLQSGTPNQPFTLVITQEELNAEIRKQLADKPELPVIDPAVWIQPGPGGIIMRARVRVNNLTPLVTVRGTVYRTPDGRFGYTLNSVDVGGLPLPDAIRSQIADLIRQAIEEQLAPIQQNLPVTLTSIQVLEGRIIIDGQTK